MKVFFHTCLWYLVTLLFSCRDDAYHKQKMKELLQNYAEAYDTRANFMRNRLKAAHYRKPDNPKKYNNIRK